MSTGLANPLWLGPQTYQERDRARFHGRDAETAELLDLIRREPLVLLHGESGHGKSSLLQAGLAPRLREQGALPIMLRDLFRQDVPDITAALLAAIVAQAAARDCTAPEPRPGDTLWEYFHRTTAFFTGPDGQSLVPVLILDQFEDLFRRCDWRPGDEVSPAAHFLAQLADLLENREPAAVRERRLRREGDDFDHAPTALRVLIGLREDALPDLTPLRAPIPGLARTPFRLRPLTRDAACQVILRPVAGSPAHAGLLGENPDTLAGDILTRMAAGTTAAEAAQSVDPFLLSVVMDQLHRHAAATQPAVITHALVQDGVAAALETFYEDAIAQVPTPLRDWLETDAGLVTAGGFRNSIADDDAKHALRDPATSTHLRTLENAHLLRAEPRPDGSLRFELVHDRLCAVLASKIRLRADARAEQERARLEAQADEERRRAALLDAARKRALLVAAVAIAACIVATLFYFQARAAKREALTQKGIADAAALRADDSAKDARLQEENAKLLAKQATTEQARATTAAKEAEASEKRATTAAKVATAEKDRAIGLIRFMDTQIGEAFTDAPVQLRERVTDRLDAFYRSQGEPATDDERQRRMGHHYRKAMVHLASAARYQEEKGFNEMAREIYAEQERKNAAVDFAEALRYGDLLAAAARDDRRITRDRILAHYQLSIVSKLLDDTDVAKTHLRAARELRDALVKGSPFPLAQWIEWMGLPEMDTPAPQPKAPRK